MNVIISSADPVAAAALGEVLRDAGLTGPGAPVYLCDADAPAPAGTPALYIAKDPASSPQPALKKPVRLPELIARLHELARSDAADLALNHEWSLNPATRLLQHVDGNARQLTEKEVQLIACLLAAPKRSASRQHLLEQVWGYGDGIDTHTLETHLYRLRAKLKDIGGEGWITATDDGYRICA